MAIFRATQPLASRSISGIVAHSVTKRARTFSVALVRVQPSRSGCSKLWGRLRVSEVPNRAFMVRAEPFGEAVAVATTKCVPSTRLLFRHFICCAVPMVGFGFMDNTILIRAGDAIDNALGDEFGLTGLECAAAGQVLSDFSGVLFGGVIESLSRRFILPPALSEAQHLLRITQVVGVAGASIGVIIGCTLGMCNLLTMDLKATERKKQLSELHAQFNAILVSATKAFKAGAGSIFVVGKGQVTLRSFGATGIDTIIEVPMSEGSLVGWAAVNNEKLNVPDAYEDRRFNKEFDRKLGKRTRAVLCIPIRSQYDEGKVIAVVQLLNKDGGFSESDVQMATMLAEHTSILFTDKLNDVLDLMEDHMAQILATKNQKQAPQTSSSVSEQFQTFKEGLFTKSA